MQALVDEVCGYFSDPVDDREMEELDHVKIREVAAHFGVTLIKARKLLITGGKVQYLFISRGSRVVRERNERSRDHS